MNEWLAKDDKHVWHPFTALEGSPSPLLIESANGIYLHTADGRKIIDGISSWWVNIHGHGHPTIAKAIAEQVMHLDHIIFAGFTHKPAIQLAENLLSVLGGNFSKVFFSDNGSTAVEVALKIAIQFWRNKGVVKNRIVAIEGAYHGDTFGAMSVGERSAFTHPFANHLFHVDFIPFPVKEDEGTALSALETYFQKSDVAAFIFEPLVQAAAGMRIYSKEFLNKALELCMQYDVISIADEVFTGFGRTGKLFAFNHLEETPDIIALSKGITGGVIPLGVTACSTSIVDAFQSKEVDKTFFHGHSFTGNPIACASANASFQLLRSSSCQQNISLIGDHHQEFAKSISSHRAVKDVRTIGTILAIELATGAHTSYFNDVRKVIYKYFLSKDILLRPLGNVIYLLPPYVIQPFELQRVYAAINNFLEEYSQGELN